jgi:hypothetical protein
LKTKRVLQPFSQLLPLKIFNFCEAFVIVASILSVKITANHAEEEAAIVSASALGCVKAQKLAKANKAELADCDIENDFDYIVTFARLKSSEIAVFSKLGINDHGLTGRAKAK